MCSPVTPPGGPGPEGDGLGPRGLCVGAPPPRSLPALGFLLALALSWPLQILIVLKEAPGGEGGPFTFPSNRFHTRSFQICRHGWFGDSHPP